MQSVEEMLLLVLVQRVKPFLFMLMHNRAKRVSDLAPLRSDFDQNHPPL